MTVRIFALPGVYTPQDDTSVLVAALRREPGLGGADVLDVGTGSGALAVAAARHGAARVTAVDVSRRAVLTARLNVRLAGYGRSVRVHRGDLLEPVRGRRFDLVLANPPYVPSPDLRLPHRGAARAWDASGDGRAVVDRLCARVPGLLGPGGVFLLVHSALCGTEQTVRQLTKQGLETEVADRCFVPFGPVMRGRAGWLESRGLIVPGQDKEELVVFRARRP